MTREQIEALMGLEKKATAREWNRVCNVLTGLWCIGRIEEHTAKQLGGSADSELACELRNAAPDLFRLALYGLAAEKVVDAFKRDRFPGCECEGCKAIADLDAEGKS